MPFGRKRRERSGSGAPVIRHAAPERELEPAHADDDGVRAAVEAHYEQFLGDGYMVWHEVASHLVHLDVYMWWPTPDRPFFTFATVGMSERRMAVPPDGRAQGIHDRAELLICLPEDWPVPGDRHTLAPWRDEAAYLPVRWLKQLGRLPHEYGTWLGMGHTVPNGDPPEPFAPGWSLAAWLVVPPVRLPEEFFEAATPDGGVACYAMVGLTPDELAAKLAHGTGALFDGFDAHGVSELLDPHRGSSLR